MISCENPKKSTPHLQHEFYFRTGDAISSMSLNKKQDKMLAARIDGEIYIKDLKNKIRERTAITTERLNACAWTSTDTIWLVTESNHLLAYSISSKKIIFVLRSHKFISCKKNQ